MNEKKREKEVEKHMDNNSKYSNVNTVNGICKSNFNDNHAWFG